MRKRLLITTVILSAILGFAYAAIAERSDDFIVQGIEYNSTLRNGTQPRKAPTLRSGEKLSPGVRTSANASQGFVVEWDKIEHWAGSGPNKAALLVQFDDGKTQECYVWGYRWDPDVLQASGEDMFRTIAAECNDLLLFTQYTGWMGNTVCGIGYSKNNALVGKLSYDFEGASTDESVSFDYFTPNEIMGQTSAPGTATQGICENAIILAADTHIIEHPINARDYGYPAYDYDWWQPAEELPADMRWQAGWYKGYWSYWCGGVSSSSLSYSGLGMTSRKLTNECVDAWSYNDIAIYGGAGGEPRFPLNYVHFLTYKTDIVNNGICYKVKNYSQKTVEVVAPFEGVTAYSGNIVIPVSFEDEGITYTVVAVGDEAFAALEIGSVTLPETVSELGNGAFEGSTITSINLTDNITSIGTECFAGCPLLTEAYIPSSLTAIPDYCFMGTALSTLTFGDNIEVVGEGAYSYCSALTNVTLSKNVRTLGAEAFARCDALVTFTSGSTVPPSAQANTFDDGISATLIVPLGFDNAYRTATGWSKFTNYDFITLPVSVGDRFTHGNVPYLVTAHEGDVHEVKVTYHPIEGVVKPSLTQIKASNQAAYDAGGNITIPSTINYQGVDFRVTAVNDTAFYYADKITSISIPDGVKFDTGARVFCFCSALESVTLPSGMTKVGQYMFDNCTSLTSITLPEGITEIGNYGFNKCSKLSSIAFPTSLTTMGTDAFRDCSKLSSITLPDGFTTLSTRAFLNCTSLEQIDIPTSLTEISMYSLSNTGFTSFTVPSHITTLGNYVFSGCKKLTSVSFENANTSIGTYLFQNCDKLVSIELPANLKSIPNYTFYGCKALTELTFPSGINNIGTYAFYGCTGLESIALPDAVKAIPANCFQMSTALKYVTISPNATSLGANAFDGCTALEAIKVSGVEFDDENDITRLPATVTSIGNYCFRGAKAFNMTFHEGLKTLGTNAFENVLGLEEAILPSTLTAINGYCFKGCTNLKTAVIPASVTTFGAYDLFFGCNDATIYIGNPNPKACSANTWRKATGEYHSLTIPTCTNVTFSALTGWKNATLVEPEITSAAMGAIAFDAQDDNVVLTSPLNVVYASEEIPTAFTTANNTWLATGVTASATNGSDTYDGAIEYLNGNVKATFTGVPTDTQVTYTIGGEKGGQTIAAVTATYGGTTPQTCGINVDFNKIDNWAVSAPEATNNYAVVFRWNDCVEGSSSYYCPLDNLVMGAKGADATMTVDAVLGLATAQNRRLSANSDYTLFGYEMVGDGHESLTAYDHNKANSSEKCWHYWLVNANGTFSATDLAGSVTAGQILVVDYQPTAASEPTVLPDMFYLPSDDKIGVFMPETTTFVLRDNCHLFVPYFVNVGEGGSYRVTTASENFNDYVTSAPMVSNQSSGNTTLRAHMNFVTGKTGSFPLSVTATIDGTEYNANTNVTIAAPVNPITAITLSETEPIVITGYPNRNYASLTYSFEPADASYTKIAWSSTDNLVATVSSGKISAGGKQGTCEVRATYAADNEVYGAIEVQQVLNQLVEEILFGDESGVFNLEYMDILLVAPTMLPENADNKNFSYEIIGDPEIATTYTTKDIINHKPGTVQVKITALDGSDITKTMTVNFAEPNRTPLSDNYQDGTFWLNEEWFTHTNGSINYITADGDIKYRVYESQNPYECFGATSCSAVIYGDRIYVSSKQHHDNGDTRPGGGRLVIFDAKTLKKLAAFRDIDATGGDGRTVVGVNPEKVYVGTNAGIKVLTVDNEDNTFTLADSYIEGTSGGSLYAGQIGDMVCVDGYVFAVKQSVGVYVIDTATDKLIATIPETAAVALCQSYDGSVWCASTSKLYHIDTENLEFDQTYTFPSSFPQSWSAWRPSNLFASKNENVLYWGHSAGWNAGCDWIYRWEIGTEFPTQPIFNSPFPSYPGGTSANKAYAGAGYDSRTNTLLVASCSGAGTSARYNHINYIDGTTGELIKSVEMKPYFWFPSHPLFPDKYAPEFSIENLTLNAEQDSYVFDIREYVNDRDNHNYNIHVSLDEVTLLPSTETQRVQRRETSSVDDVAEVSLDGHVLTITPKATGKLNLAFTVESNGKTRAFSVPVEVTTTTGVPVVSVAEGELWYADGCLEITGYEGYIFTLCDMSGRSLKRFAVTSDTTTLPLSLPTGVYVARGESANGFATLKFVVR